MTKLHSVALAAALLAGAGAASAASPATGAQALFAYADADRSDGDGLVEIGRVDAPAGGVVEVYDYRAGQVGRLLGTEAVDAGTSWDVRVNVGMPQRGDVIAVLKAGGQVVDEQVIGHGRD